MASYFTRAEKTAPIFSRITGLIRSGQLKWEDRPLWFDSYVLYPPFDEPVFDRKMPMHDQPVRKLFYNEDIERARVPIDKKIFTFNEPATKDQPNST